MFAAAALLLAVNALVVHGGDAPRGGRVALVLSDGDDRLLARLGAELRAQRFEVIEAPVTPSETAPQQVLERVLRETGAQVAIRVDASATSIRVWIANATTGKQIFREVAPEEQHVDRAVVALWAVELLRASGFAPLNDAPPRIAANATPPAAPTEGVALELAPGAALSPGGLGASLQLMVGARWHLAPHAGVEALVLVPTLPMRLEAVGGVALVSVAVLGVGAFVASGAPRARWSAQAAAGASLAVVHAAGDPADATFAGRGDTTVGGGPYLRAGAAVRTTGWLRVRADVLAGLALPRPVVVFDQASVAHWGRPWTAALLGIEAVLP
jgi:hypothetical protein